MSLDIEQERREFEAWAATEKYRTIRKGDFYTTINACRLWEGWLAAKRSTTGSEPVAIVGDASNGDAIWQTFLTSFVPIGTFLYTAPPSSDAKDAERYRWLRDSPDSGRCLRLMYEDGIRTPDFVDAEIDAAKEPTP